LTTIIGSEQTAPRVNVVLLHGYSMNAADLAPFARSLGVAAVFHFPEAPTPCAEGGLCWWPLDAEGRRSRGGGPRDLAAAHPPGRDAARAALHETLNHIAARWPTLPLVIGGFSQGAMLSCDYLLQHAAAIPVAGLVVMSSSRLAFDEWEPRLQRLSGLPALVSHGTRDEDLSFDAGAALEAALRRAGAHTEWLPFEGGHEIPLVVWRALKRFLLARASAP
jgi:phospholipase/carboxylesterase